jgi:peptide/nickel transport system ATP-binding protein
VIGVHGLSVELVLPAGAMHLRRTLTLDAIDFDLVPGRTLAVIGESGAGKSILLLALMGLLPPGGRRRGTITLDGRAISDAQLRSACGRLIGFAPQSLSHLDPTASVGRQIAWAARRSGLSRSAARGAVAGSLERFALPRHTVELFPHQLSGGMARRVLLAAATVGRPRLLLVDEPTSGLDDANTGRVAQDLARIAQDGTAIIVVTHDLPLALRSADAIALMRNGRMLGLTDPSGVRQGGTDAAARYAHALFRALPEQGMEGLSDA